MDDIDTNEDWTEGGSGEEAGSEDIIEISDPEDIDDCAVLDEDQDIEKQGNKVFKGFTVEDERVLYPIVDGSSMLLFDIVQSLEKEHVEESAEIIRKVNGASLPLQSLGLSNEFSGIRLQISPSVIQQKVPNPSVQESTSASIDSEFPVGSSVFNGTDRPFPPEKVKMLAEPLKLGWKREIVLRSGGSGSNGKKKGDVYYYSPQGVKFRSSKQLQLYLEDNPFPSINMDNFTFAKVRVCDDISKEVIRNAFDGKAVSSSKCKKAAARTSGGKMDAPARAQNCLETSSSSQRKSFSSRRIIQPPKRYSTADSVFYTDKKKTSLKGADKERSCDSALEMGMLPPKYPRGMEEKILSSNFTEISKPSLEKKKGKGTTKSGKKSAVQSHVFSPITTSNSEDENALFQISAFRESQELYPEMEAAINQFEEAERHKEALGTNLLSVPSNGSIGVASKAQHNGPEGLLPCSISCPIMAGEIPNLQCVMCLCLYHPECLGFPPNLQCPNFLCSNCEEKDRAKKKDPACVNKSLTPLAESINKEALSISSRFQGVKKPPPPLLRAEFSSCKSSDGNKSKNTSPFGSKLASKPPPPGLIQYKVPPLKGFSGKASQEEVSTSAPNVTKKNGSKAAMKQSKIFPQLNKSLTITPICLPKKINAPPIPKLQPFGTKLSAKTPSTSRLNSSPVPALKNKGIKPKKIVKGKLPSSQENTAERSLLPKVKFLKPNRTKNDAFQNLQSALTSENDATVQKRIQTVVAIGSKKFIVVPKTSPSISVAKQNELSRELNKEIINGTTEENIPKEGEELKTTEDGCPEAKAKDLHFLSNTITRNEDIMSQIFDYLSVKDLLSVSQVCKTWNKVASQPRYWKIIRLKNAGIYDVDCFTKFVSSHQCETIDFKKMISTNQINFVELFESLRNVLTLKKVILAQRCIPEGAIAMYKKCCPQLDITF